MQTTTRTVIREELYAIIEERRTQFRVPLDPQPPPAEKVRELSGADYSLCRESPGSIWWRAAGPVWAVRAVADMRDASWRAPAKAMDTIVHVIEARDVLQVPRLSSAVGSYQDRRAPYGAPTIVSKVRAQRLQDITTDDVIAEGWPVPDVDYSVPERPDFLEQERDNYARNIFAVNWDREHEYGEDISWKDNPWVWVVTFELAERSFIREYEELCRRYGLELAEVFPDMYGVKSRGETSQGFGQIRTSFDLRLDEVNEAKAALKGDIKGSFSYDGALGHCFTQYHHGQLMKCSWAKANESREDRVARLVRKAERNLRYDLLTEKEREGIIRQTVYEEFDAVERALEEKKAAYDRARKDAAEKT